VLPLAVAAVVLDPVDGEAVGDDDETEGAI
jgi:hypothetical protein